MTTFATTAALPVAADLRAEGADRGQPHERGARLSYGRKGILKAAAVTTFATTAKVVGFAGFAGFVLPV